METLSLLTVLAALTSTSDVRAMAVDGAALWVGTTGGLVRLEGERVTRVLTPLDGLPDGTVRALLLSGDDLWVGTDRGAARLDRRTLRVERTVRTAAPVRALETWQGALWIGTWDSLLRLEGEGAPEVAADLERITALRAAGDLLYITTAGRSAHVHDGTALRELQGDPLAWDIAVQGDEAWIATSEGLRVYAHGQVRGRPAARRSQALPVSDIRAVRFVDGRLVVGTYGAGLFSWDGRDWAPVEGQPSRLSRVQALEIGPDGALLVATPDGLGIRTSAGWSRWSSPGLPDNDVSCLARTGEGLWVGTFRAGLALVRPGGEVEVWDEERGLVDSRINRLALDHEGDLWVATERGVMERTGGRWHLRGLLGQHVFLVAAAGDRVYASQGPDLVAYEGEGWSPVAGHVGQRPQDLAAGAGGAVLSGTAEGLAIGGSSGWSLVTAGPGALADDWVTAVAEWRGAVVAGTYNAGLSLVRGGRAESIRDDLWVNAGALEASPDLLAVGTLDQGLWLFDGTTWRTMTTANGLPDDDVTDVIADGSGGLWVATRGGVAHVGVAGSDQER